MKLKEALSKLREDKKRKFEQSVDLIINLRGINVKKDSFSIVVSVPHKIREKRVCGFLKEKSGVVDSITEIQFQKYKDKGALKNLVKKYDYFIATASLMPKVATTFGKILGPVGKMPSPQLGMVTEESDDAIKSVLDKIEKSVKIRLKESSVKLIVGREGMKDEEIIENITSIYNSVVNALPKKIENVKSVMVKFSMSKPIKVEVK